LIWCGFAPLCEVAVVEQKRKEVKEEALFMKIYNSAHKVLHRVPQNLDRFFDNFREWSSFPFIRYKSHLFYDHSGLFRLAEKNKIL
jgi:hypothetical protein